MQKEPQKYGGLKKELKVLENDKKQPHIVKFKQICFRQNDNWKVFSKPYINYFFFI